MKFEKQTIRKSDNFQPFKYQTSSVFRSTLYSVEIIYNHNDLNVVWTHKCGLLWVNIITVFTIIVSDNGTLPNTCSKHQNSRAGIDGVNWLVCPNVDDSYICYNIYYWYETGSFISITDKFVPLQSGSVFYEHSKLTSAQYKYRYILTLDGNHRVIFTLDDHITMLFKWKSQSCGMMKTFCDASIFATSKQCSIMSLVLRSVSFLMTSSVSILVTSSLSSAMTSLRSMIISVLSTHSSSSR